MSFQGAIFTPNSLIVNIDNKVFNAQSDHPNFARLKQAYKDGDCDAFIEAFNVEQAIKSYVENGTSKGTGVTIEDGRVFYNGQEVNNSVVTAIQRMMEEGFEITPMVKFLENMMECPSYNSIKEMWEFIEQMGLAITEDGCFLAYKTVRSDYKDKYSGQIDNTPGNNPKRLERSQVDDNCNHSCSHGYHVGALAYAGPGGWYNSPNDRVIICKVNPADVVSVPRDHSCQKLRCCYYEPVGEFRGELNGTVYSGRVGDDYACSTCSTRRFRSECVDNYDLLEDNYYIALYQNASGDFKCRFFLVDSVDEENETLTVELVEPEENAGQYRRFKMSRLQEVQTWDGATDPDTLDNPWDEEDQCECCGDHYCDGECYEDEDEDEENENYW